MNEISVTNDSKRMTLLSQDGLWKKIIYGAIWTLIITCWLCVGIAQYDIPRTILFCIGGFFFLIYVALIRKIKFKNVWLWIFAVSSIAGVAGYFYIRLDAYGIQYALAVICEHLIFVAFVILFVNFVCHWGKSINREAILTMIPMVLCSIILLVFEGKSILPFVLVISSLYFTRFTSKEWKYTGAVISYGGIVSFILLYAISLVVAPNEYEAGRYLGIFFFPSAAALTAVMGLISSVYLLVVEFHSLTRKRIGAILLLGIVSFSAVYALIKVSNRASYLGLLVLAVIAYVLFGGKAKRKNVLIRFAISILSVAVAFALLWIVLSQKAEKMDIDPLQIESARYIDRLASYMFRGEVETSDFENGTFLNVLDKFSSSRLTLWTEGLKTSSILPAEQFGVFYPNGEYMPHCHSTCICWIRRYGWLGGLPLIMYGLYLACAVAYRLRRGDKNLLLTFLWMFFAVGFCITEYVTWTKILCPLLLVLNYPILRKMDDT